MDEENSIIDAMNSMTLNVTPSETKYFTLNLSIPPIQNVILNVPDVKYLTLNTTPVQNLTLNIPQTKIFTLNIIKFDNIEARWRSFAPTTSTTFT